VENDIVSLIKSIKWDDRVCRTGFLQSKAICNEAQIQKIEIVKEVFATYDNIFWIQDYCLYDEKRTEEFSLEFAKAFDIDKKWPVLQFENIQSASKEVLLFVTELKNLDLNGKSLKELLVYFEKYVESLKKFQKYYILAVPLTNFCEEKLKEFGLTDQEIASYAVSYAPLDIDNISDSKNPLEEFAWLKTAYNIVAEVKKEDFESSTDEDIESSCVGINAPKEIKYLVDGLQIGIYLRNRMKELAGRLWYYIEDVVASLANGLGINRDDFLMLSVNEVRESVSLGRVNVTESEVVSRRDCFVVGQLDRKEIILSGSKASELLEYYSKKVSGEVGVVNGRTAYSGIVQGRVRIVLGKDDFSKFIDGEILVTSMTTPDFILLMKKAAAIVTDEGGLSCHAAIVSREMKVPCVIGCKNVTVMLNDGDLVEVDASNGVVKVLENALVSKRKKVEK
jgi:phosphohistidine swiveling domain-containing protein